MAEGVLGLGSGQAATLNSDLIDKLKSADRVAKVEPIEAAIEEITKEGGESEKLAEISAKVRELLESVKPFDLFVSGGVSVFDQKSANASGTSVIFDAVDETSINEGTTNITVTELAKRDVFQSSAINLDVKNSTIDAGDLNIGIGDNNYTFDTTDKTYDQLATEINSNLDLTASVEQVGDDSYRLVIKSAKSGIENALTSTGDASLALGYDALDANIQKSSNLEASINGIEYNVSSNIITIEGGLKITAIEKGDSSISVQKDSSSISPSLENFVLKYNELVEMIDEELYSESSPIQDKSSLRSMMEGIKSKIFDVYGSDDSLSVFNFGFEIDKTGFLSIDTKVFNEALENNPDDIKRLFMGVAEDEGLGTQLKSYIDELNFSDGLLYSYEESMNARKESLEEEKEKAIEDLDNNYALLSQQFASYGTIINQMESSFSGLKLMIEQSVATS